ncbi:MAG: response regulator [Alphaproteobacteria bacterium]|nr:response regulator [Alphaproteobacteria bacterium]
MHSESVNKCITVLLVDDDNIDVMGIKRAFDKLKIKNPIVVARDGVEALEKLRNGEVPRPYLILLDLNMPRMNGIEFLDVLREDKELRDSIVFILTTSKAEQDKWSAYQRNIAGYIVKENVGKEFLDAISLLDMYWRIVEMP